MTVPRPADIVDYHEGLSPSGSFRAVEVRFTAVEEIDTDAPAGLLSAARKIHWDYEYIRTNRDLVTRTDL